MNSLVYHLRRGVSFEIADAFPDSSCQLEGLQVLIGGSIDQSGENPDVRLLPIVEGKKGLFFDEATRCFNWYLRAPSLERNRRILWRSALRLSQLAKILCGEKVMLMHGCLLKLEDGEGVLLCGQSGMGKSTTANRWKALGGQAPADDMLLLEYGEDTLYAHPLPTWSRCIESVEGEFYPIEEAIPLKSLLALNRAEEVECIQDVEGYRYMTALYASCALFTFQVFEQLPVKYRERLVAIVKDCATELYSRFPYRALMAHLEGDLQQTLKTLTT